MRYPGCALPCHDGLEIASGTACAGRRPRPRRGVRRRAKRVARCRAGARDGDQLVSAQAPPPRLSKGLGRGKALFSSFRMARSVASMPFAAPLPAGSGVPPSLKRPAAEARSRTDLVRPPASSAAARGVQHRQRLGARAAWSCRPAVPSLNNAAMKQRFRPSLDSAFPAPRSPPPAASNTIAFSASPMPGAASPHPRQQPRGRRAGEAGDDLTLSRPTRRQRATGRHQRDPSDRASRAGRLAARRGRRGRGQAPRAGRWAAAEVDIVGAQRRDSTPIPCRSIRRGWAAAASSGAVATNHRFHASSRR